MLVNHTSLQDRKLVYYEFLVVATGALKNKNNKIKNTLFNNYSRTATSGFDCEFTL